MQAKLNCKLLGHTPYERCLFRGIIRKRNYNCVCGCGTLAKFPLTWGFRWASFDCHIVTCIFHNNTNLVDM